MRRGLQIAKVFGINIRIDITWFFIFGLVTISLANQFGDIHSDWNILQAWILAIVAAVLFFVSIAIHELAHSLVAKSQGVDVSSITLHIFGGVSNIERRPPSPKSEFWISVVGPLSSFIIGVFVTALGIFTSNIQPSSPIILRSYIGQLNPITTILLWMGSVNIILAFFNLIPGFPLDGGRILRSLLWFVTNNLKKATRLMSWVGQGIASLIIGTGILTIFGVHVPFFGSGMLNGLWLIFIGWFLYRAADASYHQLIIDDLLDDVPVREIMWQDAPTVPSNISIDNFVHNYVMRTDDYSFPVMAGQELVGLVALDDVRNIPRELWKTTVVMQIMTPLHEVISTTVDEDVAQALRKLQSANVRQLPVVREKRLVGLLRRRDILKWLQFQAEAL
jgi:Zn-dependent protease/predicted transcriptional regulator